MTDDGQQLEREIAAEAKRLGLAAIGFAPACSIDHMDIFEKWLAGGSAAGMDFLNRNKALRTDVRELVPGAKTVIVVAARYPTPSEPGKGFAMHARGQDYHSVIRKKLESLAVFIDRQRPLSAKRICVDSAPILEREWAIRAGIGWRGRQGQIVSPDFGCCLFLGELIVDIDLKPSPPVANQCGDCRLCVEACPTGALARDGLVDARKCISYLTIEHKGDIPADSKTGEALFGCDCCTAGCPWNRFGNDRVMPEFEPRSMPDTEECLCMTAAELEKRFANTVVQRTGLDRLRRNARLALENQQKK
jgi:epoxyqueuosine reductase